MGWWRSPSAWRRPFEPSEASSRWCRGTSPSLRSCSWRRWSRGIGGMRRPRMRCRSSRRFWWSSRSTRRRPSSRKPRRCRCLPREWPVCSGRGSGLLTVGTRKREPSWRRWWMRILAPRLRGRHSPMSASRTETSRPPSSRFGLRSASTPSMRATSRAWASCWVRPTGPDTTERLRTPWLGRSGGSPTTLSCGFRRRVRSVGRGVGSEPSARIDGRSPWRQMHRGRLKREPWSRERAGCGPRTCPFRCLPGRPTGCRWRRGQGSIGRGPGTSVVPRIGRSWRCRWPGRWPRTSSQR